MTQAANLCARELSKRFGVYGRFYHLSLDGESLPCRAVLELIDWTLPDSADPVAVAAHRPDLQVVMMNPGSSRPVAPHPPIATVSRLAAIPGIGLVPTRPDTTQYQIMKIMAVKGFRHARVVNLSDLREPKSPAFLAMVARLRDRNPGEVHSLFCAARSREREEVLGSVASVPVIVGWGRHPGLKPLAQSVLDRLANRRLVGVPVAGEPLLFAHPSPMLQRGKEAWIAAILAQMNA